MKLQEIKTFLGKPYFESEKFLLYNMDCIDGMKYLPNEFIDLTITSPPYNIGKEYERILPLDEYLDWSEEWITEVYRLTNEFGSFWLNLGYIEIKNKAKAIPLPYLLWDRVPFYLIQEIVWHYGAGVAGRKFYSPRNEKFLWYVKNSSTYTFNLDDVRDPNVKYPNQKKNGKIKVNKIGKNPMDVWQFPKVTSGKKRSSSERTTHPAQFPEKVLARIIKSSSNKNDLIFDPFMGSGTTASIAIKLDRKVIGFEIVEDYCEIIVERINAILNQPKLL
ncbi:MAG: site-specific DNA-methyltransferase [Tissierellales bacterium]|nr:site-specific DNA-methyltransferase [Tissierellales bacterium]